MKSLRAKPRGSAQVIGDPVEHSMSPLIFLFLSHFNKQNEVSYTKKKVSSLELKKFVKALLLDETSVGVNVTVPHKQSILPYLDELDLSAHKIGAVNVVHRKPLESGGATLIGYNTDAAGFIASLGEHAARIKGATALVIGAGGAARAVIWALKHKGIRHIGVINRDVVRAKALAKEFSNENCNTNHSIQSECDPSFKIQGLSLSQPFLNVHFCVNATSVGLKSVGVKLQAPKSPGLKNQDANHLHHHAKELQSQTPVSSSDFDLSAIDFFVEALSGVVFCEGAVGVDLIYSTRLKLSTKNLIHQTAQTPFLQAFLPCAPKSCTYMDGLSMLAHQAIKTWNIWFKTRDQWLEASQVAQPLIDFLRDRPVVLTGFMGAGKSTVGPILARELGWQWIDLDEKIEQHLGRSLNEIVLNSNAQKNDKLSHTESESLFRQTEHELFMKFCFSPKTVISLGGGAITHPKTLEVIQTIGRGVYLSAKVDTLMERLSQSYPRPLLVQGGQDEVSSLLSQREHQYAAVGSRIDTDELSPEQVAYQVMALFR